jgi:hypothetical protein
MIFKIVAFSKKKINIVIIVFQHISIINSFFERSEDQHNFSSDNTHKKYFSFKNSELNQDFQTFKKTPP